MKINWHLALAITIGAAMTGCHSGTPVTYHRIKVKHAQDPGARGIDRTPKELTVEEMLSQKAPVDSTELDQHEEDRLGEFEKSTYTISGILKSVVKRKDGDFFLTIAGKTGAEGIVEVPDPKQCEGSPLAAEISATRSMLESKYHPTETKKEIGEPITVTGVGFFANRGKPGSGATGTSPRLMPGIGVK